MIAVILAEDDLFSRAVAHRSRLQNYAVIRYRDPVKLADNLPELNPDALIVRCEDFPLHAELLAVELQCADSPRATKVIFVAAAESAEPCPLGNVTVIVNSPGRRESGALSPEAARALTACLAPRQRARAAASEPDAQSPSAPPLADPRPSRRAEHAAKAEDSPQPEPKSRLMAAAERKGHP
ncbi:hypothetical protein LWX53_10545 [bacterium]|nr:hypothetical protein [bacterium]